MLGCTVTLAVAVVLWLVWLVGWSLRSGVPPEPVTPTATVAAAPVVVATTQGIVTPTPPAPIVAVTPPPTATPLVVVIVPPPIPTPVVVVPPPTPTPVVVVIVQPTPTPALRPTRPPAVVAPPPPPPTPARIGQPVESAGLVLTVNAAVKQAELGPSTPARPGQIFVVVDLTLASERGDMPVPYAPTDFVLRDASGAEQGPLVAVGDAALRGGQLRPGELVAGRVAFEVPTAARGFVLRYEPAVALPGFRPIGVVLGD